MTRGRAIQRENPTYAIETVSRVYADVNTERGPSWYDHERWELPRSSPDGYEIADWIGTGKYSDVFSGFHNGELVALKVMKPVRAVKYNREAKILFNLKEGPSIIKLLDVVQNPESQQYTFVFEYALSADFSELSQSTNELEIKFFLYQLMRALHYSHANGVMHRDIKPQNIIYDRKTKALRLIDWGLAEFYHSGRRYNIHVASRHFKAIELLVDYQYYDYSVDIWGFGATMAGIIFQRTPFFRGADDFDMIARITAVLGTDGFDKYVKKYGIQIPPELQLPKSRGKKWSSFVREGVQFASPHAIDLIAQCLRYDHMERITAEQALAHPYFDDVRDAPDLVFA
jgi:casein kinase II subunit alpha